VRHRGIFEAIQGEMSGLGGLGGMSGMGGIGGGGMQQQDQMRMMQMMQEMQMVDSLRMYNELVERCFGHCVESFRSRKLDGKEVGDSPSRSVLCSCVLSGAVES